MKRLLIFLTACVMLISVFTACSDKEGVEVGGNGADNHVHAAKGLWELNLTEHWQVCECGEEFGQSSHILSDDGDGACSVCNSKVIDFGDGMYDIISYNEHGDEVRNASFESDGSMSNEVIYEIEYDADGNRKFQKTYENDVLVADTEYAVGESGVYEVKITDYWKSGEKSVSEYNENGDIILFVQYDPEGNLNQKGASEYAFDEEGNSYEKKSTDFDYVNSKIYICEYNELGYQLSRTVTDFDGNIEIVDRFEFECNEDGKKIWEKDYKNDVLVREVTGYKTVETDDYVMRFPEKIIEYNEDGTKMVEIYGETGDVDTKTFYKADGSVDYEYTYEYTIDEDGNYERIKIFEGEHLVKETEYGIADEGWSYIARVTEYDKAGGKTVCEYNELEDLISETRYGADGNIIQ